jgi:hypothetical protein
LMKLKAFCQQNPFPAERAWYEKEVGALAMDNRS